MTTQTQVKQAWRVDQQTRVYATDHAAVFVLSDNPFDHVAEVYGKDLEEANTRARLITAAVNALSGISIEAIEQGVVRELVGAVEAAMKWADAFPLAGRSSETDRLAAGYLHARCNDVLAKIEGREP